jgi:hypothetical protein
MIVASPASRSGFVAHSWDTDTKCTIKNGFVSLAMIGLLVRHLPLSPNPRRPHGTTGVGRDYRQSLCRLGDGGPLIPRQIDNASAERL